MWTGDYKYLLWLLILKDFKIRYRRMSLGVFWSLLNPLVMMSVYTYVLNYVLKNPIKHFSIHVMSAVIVYNFVVIALQSATISVLDNAELIKRNAISREVIPLASILSNVPHLLIQSGLLIFFVYWGGLSVTVYWLWLPVIWGLGVLFLLGAGLFTSALYVSIRDIRYVVESGCLVLFWVVPIIYSADMIPRSMIGLYQYNPVAALIMATQTVVLHAQSPAQSLLLKLAGVAVVSFLIGLEVFRRAQRKFYEYL